MPLITLLTPSPAPSVGLEPPEAAVSLDQAFFELVENQTDFAFNVAYRMLRNVEDAQDAVQEAFISAYRAFSSFKGQSKASTWFYRIVVNACV